MQPQLRTDFGKFLRGRRGRVVPPGPSATGRASRRQVPGLRRQELAEAADISVEYCTRLEQGRAPRPSREVLTSLARALDLTAAERDHLFRLAGELPPEPLAPGSEVRPGLQRLLRELDNTIPVTVHDGRLNVMARNAAAAELLGAPSGTSRFRHNIVHQGFTAQARDLLGAEGAHSYTRWATAALRSAMGRYPDDAYLQALLAELSATSTDFRDHWHRAEVTARRSGVKHLHHPARGQLTFQNEMLHDPDRDHWIVVYLPC
ncbi:helix-turn-helix transcriptional regulator [Streptomyces radicis]|uniref:XRE family transcriptional regulator n=1 Tax=Streptomyces radicis TaxID=1750517 RepID=A0A3A9W5Q0_9ACTN|nr:helix-turn-helix transcriptional regulator [Streptomyces radicis]RKN08180.1 XRE family transcriptional regulator [Streptomyces radicis]RKN20535.1 XRE family transcriptional regulator [Streptomyces radicis]